MRLKVIPASSSARDASIYIPNNIIVNTKIECRATLGSRCTINRIRQKIGKEMFNKKITVLHVVQTKYIDKN